MEELLTMSPAAGFRRMLRMALAACVELGKRQVVEDTLDAPYALGNHADRIPFTV